MVTCIEGCSCNETLIDGSSWASSEAGSSGSSEQQQQRHSLLKTRAIEISPQSKASECKMRVEVQRDTQPQSSGSQEPVVLGQGVNRSGGTEAMTIVSGHKFKVSSVLVRLQVAA